MTSSLPPVPPPPDSPVGSGAPGAGARQGPPFSGEGSGALQSAPPQPNNRWHHPTAIFLLTVFGLIPIGLVLTLTITGFFWAPWQPDAFQATTYGELNTQAIQNLAFLVFGFPLGACGLICAHFAAWLVWMEAPPFPRPLASGRIPLRTTLAAWAKAAGQAKATLYAVLLVGIVLTYPIFITQLLYCIWRVFISPESV